MTLPPPAAPTTAARYAPPQHAGSPYAPPQHAGSPFAPPLPAYDATATRPALPPGVILSDHVVGRRRRSIVLVLLAVALLAGAAVAYVRLSPTSSSAAYPKKWDSRILPAVSFVERDRGMTFKHPLPVDFLDDAQFRRRVTKDPERLTGAQRSELADTAAELEAAGLIAGRPDLAVLLNRLRASSVVGFYDFSTQHVVIRGRTLSLEATVTVVHELTHALDDQYYGIGLTRRRLAKSHSDGDASDAFLAVVEGDAKRVESDYVRSLPAAQRAEVSRQESADRSALRKQIGGIPQVLVAQEEAPYAWGRALVDFERESGGETALANLFRQPPTSALQVLQPWRYSPGAELPRVATPAVDAGGKPFDSGTFGASGWYFLLAERLGPKRALQAVDGWAADAFVAYRKSGRACLRIDFHAESARGLGVMKRALRAWSRPQTRPVITAGKDSLRLQTCQPAANARLSVPGRSLAALEFATDRVDMATLLVRSGAPSSKAPCIATRLVNSVPVSQLVAAHPSARTQRVARQAALSCR